MQQIEYKESPSPHVVITNFMSTTAARECLEEAQWLEPVYEPATVSGTSHLEDGDECDECVAFDGILRSNVRKNDIVFLDNHYKNKRHKSVILGHLNRTLNDEAFMHVFKTFPHMFPIVAQTTHMETVLSSYGMCDFYGFHKDTNANLTARRVITCVIHWNTEPQQYQGGELILTGDTIEDQLVYKPVHNTAIFFQSNKCVHAVNEIQHEGVFKDNRFSINLWFGFEQADKISGDLGSGYKYR